MATIRKDLRGSVMVAGHVLVAGDTVPRGVNVGDHVLAPRGRPKKAAEEVPDEPVGDR